MKAQKKLTVGIAMVIVAVLVASQSVKHVMSEKMKYDRVKIKQDENVEKAKLKKKQEATRTFPLAQKIHGDFKKITNHE